MTSRHAGLCSCFPPLSYFSVKPDKNRLLGSVYHLCSCCSCTISAFLGKKHLFKGSRGSLRGYIPYIIAAEDVHGGALKILEAEQNKM